jgi:serine/threonine-protein kinase
MAPEQASGAIDEHGAATDQFSLGMLLQEIITLERPRKGNEDRKLKDARKGLRLPLEVMTNGRPVRPELAAIVTTATDFLPENRYPSVEAFADDVRRFTRDEPVSVYPERFTQRLWRRLSRRPSVTLSVIFGIFSLLFLGAMVTLTDRLAMQEHAEDHVRLMRTLTSEVVRNSEAIDIRFSTAKRLVEGLAATTRSLLLYGSPNSGPSPYGAGGRLIGTGLPSVRDLGPAENYPLDISFSTPAFLYPPGVTQEEVEPTIARMHSLVNALQDTLLNSADEQAGNWPVERQESLLRSGTTPLHWSYVGFENGLLFSFPGDEIPFPKDYDPRARSWYREARKTSSVHCGRPYLDIAGDTILVPCNRSIRDPRGQLLGVAGADATLDNIASEMNSAKDGWLRSSLVDQEGREILDTRQLGLRLGMGLHDDSPLQAPIISKHLLKTLARERNGWTREGDELIVFDQLEELEWEFVTRFDASYYPEPSEKQTYLFSYTDGNWKRTGNAWHPGYFLQALFHRITGREPDKDSSLISSDDQQTPVQDDTGKYVNEGGYN